MASDNRSPLTKLLVPAGTLYLVWLALRPPPARWVGLACLAVVVPLVIGWLLGNLAGVGPWADPETR
ncbi:hypothetical protein [Halomicrobium urmianum]|uniref:hypothetical protein n=1 Tax=Halomicrobium urmianum TaxID=1586233 RepID=UPI001CD96FE3|nr:hypothetical protein [Halomicrobium urmianum]